MADRGRGRGGTTRGRGAGSGQRDGHASGSGSSTKQPILDLAKYVDKSVRVKFSGGRECTGTLKGYDQLLNLVLDNVEEQLRDPETLELLPDKQRTLGLVVIRGTALVVINPVDGYEEIANPFAQE